ncbi:uncharacterized protein LOC128670505 [Plodia interpunctella]|uniref:uncharacterized protein LOC128670505 n=1 Tax=Plodia interpunctella TaxID=58824 RepID=UPI002367A55E|nr:uncharacterized protein LOC128670505 [Plodia interpunctella]
MSSPTNGLPPPVDTESRPLHKSSFKLRFAQCRELGRSDVSLVKPLGLPSTVTDKFYNVRREEGAALEEAALRTIQDMFRRGPRDWHPAPRTSAQEYGWHWAAAAQPDRRDRRLQHHIVDSAWLKARVRVLHADALLKRR